MSHTMLDSVVQESVAQEPAKYTILTKPETPNGFCGLALIDAHTLLGSNNIFATHEAIIGAVVDFATPENYVEISKPMTEQIAETIAVNLTLRQSHPEYRCLCGNKMIFSISAEEK